MADIGMLALIIMAFGLAAGYARLCGGLLPPAGGSREIDRSFLSAATGIAVAMALVRGFARHSGETIGTSF
jgi:Potassium-transporting ATPase A subunit